MSYLRLIPVLLATILTAKTLKAEYSGPYYSVDLRDHIEFGTYNNLPTHTIQVAIESRPCHFAGPLNLTTQKPDLNSCDEFGRLVNNPTLKLTREGALGPLGYTEGETFIPTNKRIETRQNVIFSVEFDGPESIYQVSEGVFDARLLLFIHDQNRSEKEIDQYYFRKLVVRTDASKAPLDNPERVSVVGVIKDIPLSETFFHIYTDISERKLILSDTYNNIYKVFPVGVGAFDIRTLPGMDSFVGSMTEELKTGAIITRNSLLNESGDPIHVQMKEERNHPSWYQSRPFLGILDENGTKYKQIGFHYQIDEDKLRRGFISHGCIRVRDKDLYQLAVLVFKGMQYSLPVKVVNTFYRHKDLFDFTKFDHPYPKINTAYKRIIYANKNYLSKTERANVNPDIASIEHSTSFTEVERFEWCRQKGKYHEIRYHGPWASVLGTDCLTRIGKAEGSVIPILNYMNGITFDPPQISEHQTSNISSLLTTGPALDSSQNLCSVSLANSVSIFQQLYGKALTYKDYIDICGCDRFAYELTLRDYRKGKQSYRKYCR
jgi:hypothetical protein